MPYPTAYAPVEGQQYQILCLHPQYNGRTWEHCDYAENNRERSQLIKEYQLAYGAGYEFKSILLPQKYWPTVAPPAVNAEAMREKRKPAIMEVPPTFGPIVLTELENGDLRVSIGTADDSREDIDAELCRVTNTDDIILGLLDQAGYLGDGWTANVYIGLTDAPNIAKGAVYFHQDSHEPDTYEKMWWYPNYMITSYIDELLEVGHVDFKKI